MSAKVDLNALDTVAGGDAGYRLVLKAPNGVELPGHLLIRGYDSIAYQQKADEQSRAGMTRMAMTKTPPTVDQIKAESLELAGVLVMGWTVPFELDKQPLEYSAANAVKLLERFPWIREQVERAAGVRANFLPGSAPS